MKVKKLGNFFKKVIIPIIYFSSAFFFCCIFIDTDIYIFNLFRSFSVQYIAAFLVFAALLFIFKRKWPAILHMLLFVSGCIFVFTRTIDSSPKNNNTVYCPDTLRVFHYNIEHENRTLKPFFNEIETRNIDIFSINEANKNITQTIINKYGHSYPYHIYTRAFTDYNILLFSKYPIEKLELKFFTIFNRKIPYITGQLFFCGRFVELLSLHAYPPLTKEGHIQRNIQLDNISGTYYQKNIPRLIIGDFNTVPWSYELKDFKKRVNVLDSRTKITPTFPEYNLLIGFPIDYIMVSKHFHAMNFTSIRLPGSDHLAIYGEYVIVAED